MDNLNSTVMTDLLSMSDPNAFYTLVLPSVEDKDELEAREPYFLGHVINLLLLVPNGNAGFTVLTNQLGPDTHVISVNQWDGSKWALPFKGGRLFGDKVSDLRGRGLSCGGSR